MRQFSVASKALRSSRWAWGAAIVACGSFGSLIALCISLLSWPVPRIHDEFSFLLLADTILHGRLSNPTPDVWQPLQSFHIIVLPTYSSKYPIGPGLLLAVGWILAGTPAAGLWLGAGLCTACTAWMLAGVLPRRWALLGSLLVAFHPAMQTDWSQSFMNGWLTAASATLMLGVVLRMRRRVVARDAIIFGLSVGLIALCRPFEGMVVTLISGCTLLTFWLRWPRARLWTSLFKVSLFAAPSVAAALTLMAMHNRATTGCWRTMPYQVHERQYAVAPLFITQAKCTPSMLGQEGEPIPQVVRGFHEGCSYQSYKRRASLVGWFKGVVERVVLVPSFWGAALCAVPLALLSYWRRTRICQCCGIGTIGLLLASSFVPWAMPHYLAPIVPWLVLLAMRGVREFSRGYQYRAGLAVALVGLQVLLLGGSCIALVRQPSDDWGKRRCGIESRLEAAGGKHLVLIKYVDQHNCHQEWVYNRADLDSSAVIWARSCREDWDRALIEKYSSSRSIWVYHPDQPNAELAKL